MKNIDSAFLQSMRKFVAEEKHTLPESEKGFAAFTNQSFSLDQHNRKLQFLQDYLVKKAQEESNTVESEQPVTQSDIKRDSQDQFPSDTQNEAVYQIDQGQIDESQSPRRSKMHNFFDDLSPIEDDDTPMIESSPGENPREGDGSAEMIECDSQPDHESERDDAVVPEVEEVTLVKNQVKKRTKGLVRELMSDVSSEEESDPDISESEISESEDEAEEIDFFSGKSDQEVDSNQPVRRSSRARKPPQPDKYLDNVIKTMQNSKSKKGQQILMHATKMMNGDFANENDFIFDDELDEELERKRAPPTRRKNKKGSEEDVSDDCDEDFENSRLKYNQLKVRDYMSMFCCVLSQNIGCYTQAQEIRTTKVPPHVNAQVFDSWDEEQQFAFGYQYTRNIFKRTVARLKAAVEDTPMHTIVSLLREKTGPSQIVVRPYKASDPNKKNTTRSILTGMVCPDRKLNCLVIGDQQFIIESEHTKNLAFVYFLMNPDRVMCAQMLDLITKRECISDKYPQLPTLTFSRGFQHNISGHMENFFMVCVDHVEKMTKLFKSANLKRGRE